MIELALHTTAFVRSFASDTVIGCLSAPSSLPSTPRASLMSHVVLPPGPPASSAAVLSRSSSIPGYFEGPEILFSQHSAPQTLSSACRFDPVGV